MKITFGGGAETDIGIEIHFWRESGIVFENEIHFWRESDRY